MAPTRYHATLALDFARKRINNPPLLDNKPKPFEHYVGSWACTMLSMVFAGEEWLITPERRDDYSRKKPDLMVQHISPAGDASTRLYMELKKNDPAIRFEEALNQAVKDVVETMEFQIEVFVVVQCGTRIGFFEYHNDQDDLDEEGIPHFRGCISLTQDYHIEGQLSPGILRGTPGLARLNPERSAALINAERIAARNNAAGYQEPCIFDLNRHATEIDLLFEHIRDNVPRSSV